MSTSAKYRLAPGVRWVVDRATLKVSDGRGRVCVIGYPQAAVWDLFTRSYPYTKVVSMMTHIASLDERAADALVREALVEWVRLGFLEPVESRVIELRPL
jgi:hypothetical protein